jgi:hypothetical protein
MPVDWLRKCIRVQDYVDLTDDNTHKLTILGGRLIDATDEMWRFFQAYSLGDQP